MQISRWRAARCGAGCRHAGSSQGVCMCMCGDAFGVCCGEYSCLYVSICVARMSPYMRACLSLFLSVCLSCVRMRACACVLSCRPSTEVGRQLGAALVGWQNMMGHCERPENKGAPLVSCLCLCLCFCGCFRPFAHLRTHLVWPYSPLLPDCCPEGLTAALI